MPQPEGGTGRVNLNADGVSWYSDADFPHWRGWELVDDDTDADVRCNSAIVSELRFGPAPTTPTPTPTPTLASQPVGGGDTEKIKRLVCLFPTEWDESDATIDQRYGWMKTLPQVQTSIEENFDKFKAFIKALGFWQAAALTGIPATHWHLNPRALVTLLRRQAIWPDLATRWQNGKANHDQPDDTGLSQWAKTCLYEYALRSSKGAVTDHTGANGTTALSSLDAGRAVIFGMRAQTDINANRGRGLWDDRVAVLKRERTGLLELIYRGAYTSEPSGRYLDGGEFNSSDNGSNVNVGGTAHFDTGRLIGDRSYEYQPANSNGFGPNVAGTTFNILRKTVSSRVERLITTTPTLPRGTFVSGANTEWVTGDTASFNELQTMHFHRGYNGMTGSAGCQTFPVGAGETFMDFMTTLAPLRTASRFQYVLQSM